MKVILLEAVKKLGKRHEIIEVGAGYAQNFLIPQKKAIETTDEAVARIASMKETYAKENSARLESVAAVFQKLAGTTLLATVKANEQGGLYKAIDATDIAQKIKDDLSLIISPVMIDLDQPIKEVGTYTVQISHEDLESQLTLQVKAEGGAEAEEEQ